ncbi:MAG TPA: iron-containing redox enzyme family protein, partial [Candidatus Binatus sp.]|nr:iron-containing redox enzyme family protein [Candidatus Binatus sp.]
MANLTSVEFVKNIKQEMQSFHKLRINHPFVKAISAGTASMEHIRKWALQDYQFRRIVPRIVMLRYIHCSDPDAARKLFGIVEEETRGLDTGTAGHNELFFRFAGALGLSQQQLENVELAPATAAHAYYVELVNYTLPWFVVLSVQVCAEGSFAPAAAALGKGFMKNYGMTAEAVKFFTVHSEADEDHSSFAEEIAVKYLHSA